MPGAGGDRFAIGFAGKGRVATVLGTGPQVSWVRLEARTMTVHMGWAFHADIPRDAIHAAVYEPDYLPASQGVHGWRGQWLVNGSSEGIVRFDLDPPVRARTAFVPLRIHTLRVSLEEPEALLGALGFG